MMRQFFCCFISTERGGFLCGEICQILVSPERAGCCPTITILGQAVTFSDHMIGLNGHVKMRSIVRGYIVLIR